MDNLDDLGTAVNKAMQCARCFGEPMYISPGLLAPPDLAQDYAAKGFETVVPFANFRPALLKVNYIPAVKAGKKGRWTLQVIDIRSMHPGAELREAHRLAEINEAAVKEGQRTYTLHPGDTLKLETYHFLISRLVAAARD
ncbi:uncharacterized protein JCM10292_001651 [Rhodotorula paludigena]|uniref:uncharacterized protein n=1 Tax=Rhodotorula paludigena TaxID=86838 RepID=UPI003177E6E6